MKAKITAKGKRWKHTYVIEATEADDGSVKVTFDGEEDSFLRSVLDDEAELETMANNFQPPKGSMLSYYNVLLHSFFDTLISLKTEGDIGTIPHEKGVIY